MELYQGLVMPVAAAGDARKLRIAHLSAFCYANDTHIRMIYTHVSMRIDTQHDRLSQVPCRLILKPSPSGSFSHQE